MPAALAVSTKQIEKLSELSNVSRVIEGVYNGPQPDGDAFFDALRKLGIKTLISVDGATPDLVRAGARGMRYVHLPIGYSGIPNDRRVALTKAIRDLPRPIYVHCHHGKHRGPAALAYALVAGGMLSRAEGVALLKHCGTSPSYAGLYRDVQTAIVIDKAALEASTPAFPEKAVVEGIVQAMAGIDHVFEHLEEIERAGWNTPPNHPDLVPLSEAAILAELFRELARSEAASGKRPADYRGWMSATEAEAWALHELLRQSAATSASQPWRTPRPSATSRPADAARLSATLAKIRANCKSCHEAYRNN